MFFREIAGQNIIKENLINTVNNKRVSHAWIFTGPKGTGKLDLAIAYAQYISCENRNDKDSCGECKSCRKYDKLIHPDLHFVFPVVRTKKITKPISDDYINQWRNFILDLPYHSFEKWINILGIENQQAGIFAQESTEIIKKLNFKPYESEFKIMIIWMPEKMNITASNKLLKMIEEPPPKTIFILVSEDTEKIIKTILSRTQLIKVPKLSDQSMFDSIKEKYNFADDRIHEIVKISNGNCLIANETIKDFDSSDISENYERFTQLMRFSYSVKIKEIIDWTDDISKIGREKQKSFLDYSLKLIRENFILNLSPENQNKIIYLTNREKQFSEKFNKFIHKNNIENISNEFTEAYNHIERNGYNRLIFLDLALKLARLLKVKPQ